MIHMTMTVCSSGECMSLIVSHSFPFIFNRPEPGTNLEVSNFLTGYLDNEANLNSDGSCALTCSEYQNAKHHQCRSDTFCATLNPEQRKKLECRGRVRGCYGLEDELNVCLSVSENLDALIRYLEI